MPDSHKKDSNFTGNPFPGLRPFDVAESNLFFGREHQVEELLRKLSLYHFVSVVGTSGSGKSSLVRAGLLATLYNGYNAGGSSDWRIAIMRPGANPILNLAKALFGEKVFGSGTDNKDKVDEAIDILNESPLGLVQIVRANIKRGSNILILADQFEELFRFVGENDIEGPKHADHFVQLLIEAVRQQDAGIYVVITLRADFLGDCAAFEGLPEAINDGQYLIPRLNREHYKLVIEGPVNYAQGKIAPRLVQQLLNDMSNNQDQLPILQHALMRTWESRKKTGERGEPMDLINYEAIGTMSHALNQHANEAFSELNEKQKKLAELIFKCITVKGLDNRGIRRPTKLIDICAITKAKDKNVIETLEVFRRSGRGFIMPPAGVELLPEMVIDISHESLMRNWKRLEEWVDDEFESAQMYQRLSEAALLFQNGVAGLWRDPELSVALEWKEKNHPHEAWARQYNEHFDKSMHFLDESIAGKERMLAEKKRRRFITNAIVIIFLLSAGALTLWAVIEQGIAFRSAKEAIKQTSIAEKSERTAIENAVKAEKNYQVGEEQRKKAEEQTQKAEKQRVEAERQKRLADIQTIQTRIQRNKAQLAKLSAEQSEKKAELEKNIAQDEKKVADSLRKEAFIEKNTSENLRLYENAKNLALKSLGYNKTNEDNNLKALLALWAYKLNLTNRNDSLNPDIMSALFEANKAFADDNERVLRAHTDDVKGLAISPNGKYLASAGADGKVILWDLLASKPTPTILFSGNGFNAIAFSPDNKCLAACSEQKIYKWDMEHPDQKPQILSGHTDKITSIVFTGNQIVSGGLDKIVLTYNLTDDKVHKDSFDSRIKAVAFSNTKNMIGIGCEDGSIYLITGGNTNKPELLIKPGGSQVSALSFNNSGNNIAAAFTDGSLNVYYTEPRKEPLANKISRAKTGIAKALSGNKSELTAVDFVQENLLASAGLDGKVKLWQWTSDLPAVTVSERDKWVESMAISPDGKKVYSGGKDKNIFVFDIDEKDIVNRLEKKITRNLTPFEWNNFMGSNVPYQKLVENLQ